MARRARAQYLASQQAAQVANRQATNRARVTRPPRVGFGQALGSNAPHPPVAPANPAPGVGTPPGQPQAPAESNEFTPDAEYLAAAAQRQFERSQALQALTSQSSNDRTDTAEALRRMLSKAPEQRQQIKQGANRAGLFYSGQLGKQQNEYEANLVQSQSDVNLDFERREQARQAAHAALLQGAPLEEAAALAQAATRQIGRDADAASANALVPTPLDAAPAAAARPARPARPAAGRRYRWPDGKLHSRPYRGR